MSTIVTKAPSNYTYVVGLTNAIDFEVTPVTITGVIGNTLLQDLVLPSRTFVQDGQIVTVYIVLSTTSLAGGAPTTIQLNGTNILTTTPSAAAGSLGFIIQIELIRIGSTSLNAVCRIYAGVAIGAAGGANGVYSGSFVKLTGIDFTSSLTLTISASVPNGGQNITFEMATCSIT